MLHKPDHKTKLPFLSALVALPLLAGLDISNTQANEGVESNTSHEEYVSYETNEIVDDAFGVELSKAYLMIASKDQTAFLETSYFQRKALTAKNGDIPAPEHINEWFFTQDQLSTLNNARTQLLASLSDSGTSSALTFAPQERAWAQASFDCWVSRAETSWTAESTNSCRENFEHAMALLGDKEESATET